ncbi:MAG: DUF2520 domain-containing protein [Muribaculaceae bacterium]|nr:DUF2520 domain-containing protein [Muribaculaceae bacterium]
MENGDREKRLNVVLIGSGNVATSIALGLRGKCEPVQVFSRNRENAQALADAAGFAEATDDLRRLRKDADVYVVSVVDDAIAEVIKAVDDNGGLWLHTSGSVPISVFEGVRKRYGVLYPMQSFTKGHPADMSEVPFFVEGVNDEETRRIMQFAHLLSEQVTVADSETRKRLHVAAVFACNFANYMWSLSAEVLDESGLDFSVMKPLIRTTVAKLERMSPRESQTGPAVRGDQDVIKEHEAMLSGDKREIYSILSESIMNSREKR